MNRREFARSGKPGQCRKMKVRGRAFYLSPEVVDFVRERKDDEERKLYERIVLGR
jgi:hypothetical protein